MKVSLSFVLTALLLALGSPLSAQERADPKPVRPPVAVDPPPLAAQPPLVATPGFPGMTDHKELIAALIDTLDDEDADVSNAVAAALGKLGQPAVSPLMTILKDKDKSATLRAKAALALGNIGSQAQEALPVLAKALKEKDKELKKRAAGAIGAIASNPYGTTPVFPGTVVPFAPLPAPLPPAKLGDAPPASPLAPPVVPPTKKSEEK